MGCPCREGCIRLSNQRFVSYDPALRYTSSAASAPRSTSATQNMQQLSAYQKVQLARHPQRPYFLDYVQHLCSDFVEIHGDRKFGDDPAVVGGLAFFHG